MNCTHPDHEEGKLCLERAVACHKACECCLGELVKCGHCRAGEHEKCLQKRKIVSSKAYGECPCNDIAHESLTYMFRRLGEKLNEVSQQGGPHMSAIFLDQEECEYIMKRMKRDSELYKKAEVALKKITERAKGVYSITLTLEV